MYIIKNYLKYNTKNKDGYYNQHEDIFFSNIYDKYLPGKKCPLTIAKYFSRETDTNNNEVFGFHSPWRSKTNNLPCDFAYNIKKLNDK